MKNKIIKVREFVNNNSLIIFITVLIIFFTSVFIGISLIFVKEINVMQEKINIVQEKMTKLLEENEALKAENNEIKEKLELVEEVFLEAEKIKDFIRNKRSQVENMKFKNASVRKIPQEEISEITYAIIFTSKMCGVSTKRVTTIAWIETWFDREAIGKKCGEHGLIQVWWPTFRYIKNSMNLNVDYYNWRDTLIVGAIYLKDLENKFKYHKNRDDLIFAAYNAGASRPPNVILKRAANYVSNARNTYKEVSRML